MTFWPSEGSITTPQDLEDLATAAWLSQTLFAALELDLFEHLGEEAVPVHELARRSGVDGHGCARLVEALASLGMVVLGESDGGGTSTVACSTLARRHLLRAAPGYLGHSLSYRRSLADNWTMLAEAVRRGGSPLEPGSETDPAAYGARVRRYLEAMDDVARHKAPLIAERLDLDAVSSTTVIDLGGGGGAVAAGILARNPTWTGVVVDIPEVVAAATDIWGERAARLGEGDSAALFPSRLAFAAHDLLSESVPEPPDGGSGWGVVVASNVLHAYAAQDAGPLLDRAAAALADDGLLVVHDFFTDGPGRGPVKSALFDLHMMINTYQGRSYPWAWVRDRMEAAGLVTAGPVVLGSSAHGEDTCLLVGARTAEALAAVREDRLQMLCGTARALGFRDAAPIDPAAVVTAPWVEVKCRWGCGSHGAGGQCPPRSPRATDTRILLDSYSRALLVRGEPPTADFHRRMLALERSAFLSGSHRALAFTAGPCRLCVECEPDECRRPADARPSMEASGMDVYATVAGVGWTFEPVADRESPASYAGLLLVE